MHDKLYALAFSRHPSCVSGLFSPFCAPCFRHFDNTFTNPCALSLPPLSAKKETPDDRRLSSSILAQAESPRSVLPCKNAHKTEGFAGRQKAMRIS